MIELEKELTSSKRDSEDVFSDDDVSTKKKQKKEKLPLPDPIFSEKPSESGFHKTARVCLQQIRKAMLHHRWQEAAEYMSSFPQVMEDTTATNSQRYTEIIWKLGTEILQHHPNATMDDFNSFYEQMKQAGIKEYLMLSLEHSFHLLVNGKVEEAKHQLSTAESWRHGRVSVGQSQRIKLIQAYSSLLDYVRWCDIKFTLSHNTDDHDISSSQEMKNYFRKSSVNLKEIVKHTGIWDPFVLCYVDMLEFYNKHEEALKVLDDYAYDGSFPPNPNAHMYLYQYLKRHEAPQRKLLKVLKILRALVPSHELMLEYCSLLLQSDKEGDVQKALVVALEMLDYPCWKTNLLVWNYLKTIIDKLQRQYKNDWKEMVSEKMISKKDWWPTFHFTSFHARKESEENPELLEVKISLCKVLCPGQTHSYSAFKKSEGRIYKSTKKISKHDSQPTQRKHRILSHQFQ